MSALPVESYSEPIAPVLRVVPASGGVSVDGAPAEAVAWSPSADGHAWMVSLMAALAAVGALVVLLQFLAL